MLHAKPTQGPNKSASATISTVIGKSSNEAPTNTANAAGSAQDSAANPLATATRRSASTDDASGVQRHATSRPSTSSTNASVRLRPAPC